MDLIFNRKYKKKKKLIFEVYVGLKFFLNLDLFFSVIGKKRSRKKKRILIKIIFAWACV